MRKLIKEIQTIANLTINRTNRTVTVDGVNVPTLLREYQLLDQLARHEQPISLTRLGQEAFADTELRTTAAVKAIAITIRRKLTSYGARRGLVHVDGNQVSMFQVPEKVAVQAFTVPSNRHTAGPEDGSAVPELAMCDLLWFGDLPDTEDDLTVLEQIFDLLNQDDRPNAKFAPALSVGDIVTLNPLTAEAVSYQVGNGGSWIRLKGVVELDDVESDLVGRLLLEQQQTAA